MGIQPIYQFYAELDNYEPSIWRRFQVANNVSVARLGYILMTMFEMQASHLYAFEVPKRIKEYTRGQLSGVDEIEKIFRFKMPDNEDFTEEDSRYIVFDATEQKISNAVSMPEERLYFNYDFGDDWWVSLVLEDVIVDRELSGRELPRVLEGAGYGIIENCGGTPGLTALAQAFKKKKGKEYKEFSEWLGVDNFNLSVFDVDDMNFRLKKVPRIYAEIYEHRRQPTKRSIDFLERKYLGK
ncbi:MAG: plasmid pRiA4b ORF-3 family protein [Synergistaceae bacterium]|jgi:hypothetical protein|nr:plasmid pRiA4b ORF-3 family protein [Synergistaceae bacterium]